MTPHRRFPFTSLALLLFASAALAFPAGAGEGAAEAESEIIAKLPTSRHSLLDGLRLAAKAPAVPISAKFEDEGQGLILSVYVAGRGLGVDAEANSLEELQGSPTVADWQPAREVFGDAVHVARSAEQLTLLRGTKLSLADAVERALATEGGTVYSVTPRIRNGRGVFDVRVAIDGQAISLALDLSTGQLVERLPAKPPAKSLPPELLRVGDTLPEPVVGAGRWVTAAAAPLRELAATRVVLVTTNSFL